MLDYARKLLEYTKKYDRDSFIEDSLIQHAVGMCLINIGELQNRLPDEFKERNTSIPWSKIRGLRNILTHDYFSVDWITIWEVIQDGIPNLVTELEQSLKEIEAESGHFDFDENYKQNLFLLAKADKEFEDKCEDGDE
ncbi:MAG: DUF86 domain-containing protein [Clostridiales bacterium]|nr:DUF86 domain-containing protein [Clostridiales bacterium]